MLANNPPRLRYCARFVPVAMIKCPKKAIYGIKGFL